MERSEMIDTLESVWTELGMHADCEPGDCLLVQDCEALEAADSALLKAGIPVQKGLSIDQNT